VFGDVPLLMTSDVRTADALARITCRSEDSRKALIEHVYQEALAICVEYEPTLLSLATALYREKMLDGRQTGARGARFLEESALHAVTPFRRKSRMIRPNLW
jgi:hypothetical protein